jgi:hypothetical protein
LMGADYFWMRRVARQRHERLHSPHQKSGSTNAPASSSPMFTEQLGTTNHE